ncbi:MAG: hypothetical protein WA418_26895 [Bradyrhizobium sp.]
MAVDKPVPDSVHASWGDIIDGRSLRTLVVAAGIGWSVLFVVIGLGYELQLYGDGSLFSYSVAVRDAWAFHWHNIPGRAFVYLFSYVPAETYVGLTGDARGGIVVYGFLFFGAQLLGLAATFAADRSKGRILFTGACASTACLCPLVFGFPTEMWMAHAVFWPALALCHYAGGGIAGIAAVFAVLLALVFTHEGALILAGVILATLVLRGLRDAAFLRAAGACLVALAIWAWVKETVRPDAYDVPILARAARNFFDLAILTGKLPLLLLGALAAYAIAYVVLRREIPANAHVTAAALVAAALCVYWLTLDHALHADNRYYLRTVLLIATAALGPLAAAYTLEADGRKLPAVLRRLMVAPAGTARAVAGAIALVMLVHAVETAKFVGAWTDYKDAVRTLAMGTASDPELGDAHVVSAARIGPNRLSWNSTTPFLSVLVAPDFAPARLVVDPAANDFWLSCATATASEAGDRAVPAESRRLVRVHACLHR